MDIPENCLQSMACCLDSLVSDKMLVLIKVFFLVGCLLHLALQCFLYDVEKLLWNLDVRRLAIQRPFQLPAAFFLVEIQYRNSCLRQKWLNPISEFQRYVGQILNSFLPSLDIIQSCVPQKWSKRRLYYGRRAIPLSTVVYYIMMHHSMHPSILGFVLLT